MAIRIWFLIMMTVYVSEAMAASPIRLSEPIQQDGHSETFGEPLNQLPEVVELQSLLRSPDTYLDNIFSVQARVAKVCQKKGCFFIAQQGENSMRVAFKDYGFFVPTDISGRQVTLVGQLVAREISAAQAKHLSTDLGDQDSVRSGPVYEIIATSVRVPLK